MRVNVCFPCVPSILLLSVAILTPRVSCSLSESLRFGMICFFFFLMDILNCVWNWVCCQLRAHKPDSLSAEGRSEAHIYRCFWYHHPVEWPVSLRIGRGWDSSDREKALYLQWNQDQREWKKIIERKPQNKGEENQNHPKSVFAKIKSWYTQGNTQNRKALDTTARITLKTSALKQVTRLPFLLVQL